MTLQWIDYHLFQGFDHFFIYDHLFNRNENNVAYFYDILTLNDDYNNDNYFDKGYVTLIEWPYIKRNDDLWNFEIAAYFDSYRRFAFDTKYIFTGDCDEFIIPKPNYTSISMPQAIKTQTHPTHPKKVLINNNESQITIITTTTDAPSIKQKLTTSLDWHFADVLFPQNFQQLPNSQMINVNQIVNAVEMYNNYNAIEILTYPGLPNVFKYWTQGFVDDISKKQLGCDEKNNIKNNQFDTLLERHSCLHYKALENDDFINKKRDQLLHLVNTSDFMFDYVKTKLNIMKGVLRLGLSNHKDTQYEVTSKLIVEPKRVLLGFFHHFSDTITRNNVQIRYKQHWDPKLYKKNQTKMKQTWDERQYDMFILHTRDHWNRLFDVQRNGKTVHLFDFENSDDVKYFYTVTQTDCNFQNIILYWNEKFLNSKFGQKWKDKTMVKPLIDKDGVFCYLKNQTEKNNASQVV